MSRFFLLVVTVWFGLVFSREVSEVSADEGMWLFNDLPVEQLKNDYDFAPDADWADRLMKSCVRFNVGGSASFVSSNGLVLTNHHVGSDTLHKLSTKERDLLEHGFLAKTMAEELQAPDLELNQLISIRDVTARVNEAVSAELTPAEAAMERRAVTATIEKEAAAESGLRSDVVTLYGGGRYHLYQYKKYTDVRLVWAPEAAAAFFGGDADNFEYPRYCLDACIFRVYENGQPAKIEHFLRWSATGPGENELVFVAGNPGHTSRINTVAALKHQRDVRLPYVLDYLRRREILMQQFGLESEEHKRRSSDQLFGIQNARKARTGMIGGLQDPRVFGVKEEAEQVLREKIAADPALASKSAAFERIAEVQAQKAELQGQGIRLTDRLYRIASMLVQLAVEDKKPSAERLREYRDSNRESLLQQLLSKAPIYKDLETTLTADSIARMCEIRGGDDKLCQIILNGKSPQDRAAELIGGTKLDDPEFRKSLVEGGLDAIESSDDPLIVLAKSLDSEERRVRKLNEELEEIETQAYAEIAEAIFATSGTSTYPDATFTLRLAFGRVSGYDVNGKTIPPWTVIGGAFDHQQQHAGQDDYELPESWESAKNQINLATPYNFVCTADIIGGNSGSPVINRNLEVVGLIFDGNIQSLTADYMYTDTQSRAVSVHSSAIRELLVSVYGASELAQQLGK